MKRERHGMALDSTVMNVSVSQVVPHLHATVSGLQVTITLFALIMAALMMTGGKIDDIWGRLRAYGQARSLVTPHTFHELHLKRQTRREPLLLVIAAVVPGRT